MAHFYDLTGGTASGMTDSKIPDGQAGAEKALNHALVGNAGANLIYESAGMHASLLGFLAREPGDRQRHHRRGPAHHQGHRGQRGDACRFETIKDVCLNGPGHYLGSGQTLQLMQTEYLYPAVGDRRSPNEWTEQGATSVTERATRRVQEILATHFPRHVPDAIDDEIRRRFPVRLKRQGMRPQEP